MASRDLRYQAGEDAGQAQMMRAAVDQEAHDSSQQTGSYFQQSMNLAQRAAGAVMNTAQGAAYVAKDTAQGAVGVAADTVQGAAGVAMDTVHGAAGVIKNNVGKGESH